MPADPSNEDLRHAASPTGASKRASEHEDGPSTAPPRSAPTDVSAILLDHLDQGVWALAADGTVLSVNRAGATAVGADADELVGTSFPARMDPPLDGDGWRQLLDHVDGGRRHRVRTQLNARHGRSVPTDLDLGRHRTVQTDVVTVTSRAAADATDVRLRAAVEVLTDGVALVDPSGRIEQANDAFCRLVGRTQAQVRQRSVFDPPWMFRDVGDRAVAPEESAAVICLRSGQPVVGPTWSVALSRSERLHSRMTAHPIPGGAVVVLEDMSTEVSLRSEIRALSETDELTGLGSRSATYAHLADALSEGGRRVGVLHADLDSFRTVNDTFGPAVGDAVLVQVADRLRALVAVDDTDLELHLGRVGVDEFVVIVSGAGPSLAFDVRLRGLADELQRSLQTPIPLDGLDVRLTASVGVARSPADATDAEDLVSAAGRALVAGRMEGRNRLRFYEAGLDAAARTGLALDRDLRRAAAARQLEVHYQPIIDLRTGSVAMAEALVRWHHPDEGPIPPSVFIPTAEATGAISAVSDLVLSTVARDVAGWNRDGILPPRARIAVNISPTEFEQRDFTERLAATLDQEGVSPSQLELEITESLLVEDLRAAAARLAVLDDMGFLIALDDFGTGYSSLSYLHTLPFHTLKIDRRFVGDLRDDRSGTITRAILTLAHNLGIVAVAEGVETEPQRSFLAEAGCDLVQGFFYAPPMPRTAFERFLTAHGGVAPGVDDALVSQR